LPYTKYATGERERKGQRGGREVRKEGETREVTSS